MPFTLQTKKPGDLIRSSDWNDAMTEIVRLNGAKLEVSGGSVGALAITNDLSFGASTRQMINLYNSAYALGIQASTLYFRTDGGYAWFLGGSHNDNPLNPGTGGKRLMAVNSAGDLVLSGRTNPTGDPAGSSCRALVDIGNQLIINYANDYNNGTLIHGSLEVQTGIKSASLEVTGGMKSASLEVSNQVKGGSYTLGDDYQVTSGEYGMFIIFPGGGTPTRLMNMVMATNPGPNPYKFRVGHVNINTGGLLIGQSFAEKFSVDNNGNVHIAGQLNGHAADYSEFFESEDGKEIPQGISVVIGKEGKIRPAKKDEIPIGIVTKSPAILGNNPMNWHNQFLRDEYGNHIMEKYEEDVPVSQEAASELAAMVEKGSTPTAKDKKRLLKKIKGTRPKQNPDFDASKPYIPREERPEWQIVGLLGQLRMAKGQPVAPGWIKISDISEKVEWWLVK